MAGENTQKTWPYLTFTSSNLKTRTNFAFWFWVRIPCDNIKKRTNFLKNHEILSFIHIGSKFIGGNEKEKTIIFWCKHFMTYTFFLSISMRTCVPSFIKWQQLEKLELLEWSNLCKFPEQLHYQATFNYISKECLCPTWLAHVIINVIIISETSMLKKNENFQPKS